MTEKRFTIDVLDENNWLIQDTKTGENANPIDGTTNVLKGLISTLNKFNDENEQLRKDATTLIYANQDYRHENEQLRKENKELHFIIQQNNFAKEEGFE